MKNQSLLFLASLAVLTSGASAAMNQPVAEPVVLPAYVVTAPRHLPVELQIDASLRELSQRAQAPVLIVPELPALRAFATAHNPLAVAQPTPSARHLAKS